MAMRTGKTKVIIDDFGMLESSGEVDDILIIAPAGVYRLWKNEFETHASDELHTRLKIHIWQAKDNSKEKIALFKKFMNTKKTNSPRALLINIEALSSVRRARELCIEFLQQRRCYLAIDESTTIKNVDSKRSEFVVDILSPLASHKRILSGLPTPRSPLDAFAQFEFLGKGSLGHSSFISFKNRYAIEKRIVTIATDFLRSRLRQVIGSYYQGINLQDLDRKFILSQLDQRQIWYPSIPKIEGYRNEDELRQRMEPLSYRVTLDQCYDLPPKIYSVREVAMTDEQKKIYNDIKHKATAELASKDHVTALSVISQMLRCHQVLCGHVRDEMNQLHTIKSNRTNSLLELLEQHDGKTIIWCSYDFNVEEIFVALKHEYSENSVARFWGGNPNSREQEEKRFQEDDECQFMVATAAAGGRGRKWVVADLVVYYSNTNNLEHRDQSEQRAQGIDKVNSVAYIDLMVPGTVDEKIIHALRNKIDMAATITGDNWREWVI